VIISEHDCGTLDGIKRAIVESGEIIEPRATGSSAG
jgi:hypothetical protein